MAETTDLLKLLRHDFNGLGWWPDEAALIEASAEAADKIEQLQAVYEAARGLCYGGDWNNGNQVKLHGYRQKLIDAVEAIEPLPPGAR